MKEALPLYHRMKEKIIRRIPSKKKDNSVNDQTIGGSEKKAIK